MAISIKPLANGQLPATIGDLYTCPASTQAIIKTIKLVNTDTSARAVNIYLLPSGGTARLITPKNLILGIQYMMVDGHESTLEAGDKIQGDAAVASKVDYTISGVEET